MTSRYISMIHIQNPVYYRKFRHIQAYSRPAQTYSPINCGILNFCVTFAYSEPYHILKPGIFRTRDILRTLLRYILTFSARQNARILKTLSYLELYYHIQNFGAFRTQGIFRILLSCLYWHFNLTYFSTKFQETCAFWLQWRHFNARIYLNNTRSLWTHVFRGKQVLW